jgi:CBS domain-containing protein
MMGRLDVRSDFTPEDGRVFTKALLRDLAALEEMINSGMIEDDIRRIGAEQELFLVNDGWRPAPLAVEVLARLRENGPFTTELARFNLEVNLAPQEFTGDCFRYLEDEIRELVGEVRSAANDLGAEVVMAGILPTLGKSDLTMENITPRVRYYALNDAMTTARQGEYRLQIQGTDELHIQHDSVMLEACNTSAQVHLQVSAAEFANFYNVAQVVTAPVLAAAANSPLLFGKRLWAETRIALFQQSLDTRSPMLHTRELSPRVRFGEKWVTGSATELFHEDIARFRVLLVREIEEDPRELLADGKIPTLDALQLYNSTIYRWNRPCYGISNGKPHLRIECRALPAGPTIQDEIANAAFWLGLVMGAAQEYGDISRHMEFDHAKSNFLAASRMGLQAILTWVNGETFGVRRLIREELLPLARKGLESVGINAEDIDRNLGIIESRVEVAGTGSNWMLRSLSLMKGQGTSAERLAAITAAMAHRQAEDIPVHEWPPATLDEGGGWKLNYLKVEQYMTTELFTVNEDELVDLVAFLMDRKAIRHVLVEDADHRLVGLVSYRSLLRVMSRGGSDGLGEAPAVREVMEPGPVTVAPETPTLEAIDLMRKHKVSCLPVIKAGRLVGIVSERDFMSIAYELLEERLQEVV